MKMAEIGGIPEKILSIGCGHTLDTMRFKMVLCVSELFREGYFLFKKSATHGIESLA